MTSLKPGDYIVCDFKSLGRKTIEVRKLTEKDFAYDRHEISGERYGSFSDLTKMKGQKFTEMRPAGLYNNGYNRLDLPLNYWRMPDKTAQEFFSKKDDEISRHQILIEDLKHQKAEYAEEHRLEWEMPTLKDLEKFTTPPMERKKEARA